MENTENAAPAIVRGTIVEFDFTAIRGAEMLFNAAKEILKPLGVTLTDRLEAQHLAGGNAQGALAELFEAEGVSSDSAQAAKDLAAAFAEAVDDAMEKAFTAAFVAFAKTLAEKGVKVVLATHGDAARLQSLIDKKIGVSGIVAYSEPSTTYGCCKWDAWRRAAHVNGIDGLFSAAVTGSGIGVKSALIADFAAAAVVNPRVEYQDFGGADVAVDKIDETLAKEVLTMLHL